LVRKSFLSVQSKPCLVNHVLLHFASVYVRFKDFVARTIFSWMDLSVALV
jgi:hypothetical protein